jgi:transcription-repair coupling factor (superfamily II helicase)
MTEIKGKNERILFTFRADAKLNPKGVPDLVKKYKDRLLFTAYGTPYFTYKYYRTGLVEKDAELLLADTEMLLGEMKELLTSAEDD